MKNKINFQWLILAVLISTVIACKKENQENLRDKNLQLIMHKNWVPVFFGYDLNGNGVLERDIMDLENALGDCQLDDYYIFDTDSTFDILPNQITNGCGTGGGPFTWGLGANGTDFDYPPYKGKLITVTDSSFHFYLLDEDEEKIHLVFER